MQNITILDPFKATFSSDGSLKNTNEFLLWLEANPEKTHGSGRLVASVCDFINYQKAKSFLIELQDKGSVPYSTFMKEGGNCSRIVTDTILSGTDISKIRQPLLWNKLFTPSPLGNVQKASLGNAMYQVEGGSVIEYPESVFRENLTNYFDKNAPKKLKDNHIEIPDFLRDADFLSGIGSGAYFLIAQQVKKGHFEIRRYTEKGVEDFRGVFVCNDVFDMDKDYHFVYDSNCKYCHIFQNGKKVRFDLTKRIFN